MAIQTRLSRNCQRSFESEGRSVHPGERQDREAVRLGVLRRLRNRQWKSFYSTGLLNTGWALWLISYHYERFDNPRWAIVVIGAGWAALAAGVGWDTRERTRLRARR